MSVSSERAADDAQTSSGGHRSTSEQAAAAQPSPTPAARPGTDAAIASRHAGESLRDVIARYYSLTKPGVLYANVLSAVAGFLFGSQNGVDLFSLVIVTVGTTLIVGSATVLNNVLDRDIDQRMERTKKRATVTGGVRARRATIFSIVLGLLGAAVLGLWSTPLVLGLGVFGFVCYVWLYGATSKRMSYHGTLVGSVSGAVPILAGYVGATGRVDAGAVLVFLALFFWQMPEFYSIAIYRREEYAAAGVPVITVVKGVPTTIVHIFVYTVLYVASVVLLGVLGFASLTTTSVLGLLGVVWIAIGALGFTTSDKIAWSHRMFGFSLVSIMALCIMLGLDPWLP
ncbi:MULTISPECIES: heme o synthase [unclassified Pseudoclavibacter]|uniref:heme o synthase n=1 Tax=unclassified Pseudoclavibacter TaxID=2615177 RepID=UPI0013015BD9|nr:MULTISPECIES: heme o synthase [unclassified Pseudoclavibacter]KAB1645741.1 protoheme IX farnesyltransferase [Pseudoclavibacter sp. CFCC 14310]KAB1664351.1 protoheme IX farnesyltransferase [Pseudoclavibacter sp. CFCC 13611]